MAGFRSPSSRATTRPEAAPARGPGRLGRLPRLAALLGSLAWAGCNLLEGYEDLGDSLIRPDAALLDKPGRKLVSGQYRSLVLDGSLENGGFVLAFRTDTPEQRLAIVPFLEGEPCEVESALGFERLSSRVDVALSGLVAVQVTQNDSGRGKIRFVGFDCKDRMPALEEATLPRIEFPTNVPRGLLTLTGDRQLYLANADLAELQKIADNVSLARVADNRLWTLEKGRLVVRNSALTKLAEIGEGVVEFQLTLGTAPAVVFRDDTGIHTWGDVEGVRDLASEGCSLLALDPSTVAYYSPCEARRLVIELPGSKVGSRRERVRLLGPENVVYPSESLLSFGTGELPALILFATSEETTPLTATLNLVEIVSSELPDEEEIELAFTPLVDDGRIVLGNVFRGWDGVQGDLYWPNRDAKGRFEELQLLAQRVAQIPGGSPFSGRGVLARFDGEVGDLVKLTMSGDTVRETVLARRVPWQHQTAEKDTGIVGFVSNFDEGAGEVTLLDGSDLNAVGRNGFPGTLRFLDQPRALAYLARSSKGFGARLEAYLLESGLTQALNDGVNEYRIVPWPSPGILYAVADGEDRGLWFSKAR